MDRKKILQDSIDRISRVYYYTGKAVLSDDQFDAILNELKGIDPNDPRVTRVGAPIPENTARKEVKHRARQNSLEKVETEADLRVWYEKHGSKPLTVELKADGATIIAYYVDGVLDVAVTRGGDEGIGLDTTQNAMKFKGLPKVIKNKKGEHVNFTGAVRGEAILTYEDYKKLDPTMSGNSRNIGTGIINRDSGEDSELITFLAFNYEVLDGITLHFDQEDGKLMMAQCEINKLTILHNWGFETMLHRHCPTLDDAIAYWHETDALRKEDKLSHKIDGIVFKIDDCEYAKQVGFSSGRPVAERVLKFEAPGAITKVIGLTPTVGHTGVQKPTAQLEMVVIDNTEVRSAQLNNWEIITALDIAIGDTVLVRKAKDIIPEIVEVLERPADRVPIPEPTKCYVCGGPAGRVENVGGGISAQTYCLNDDCSAKSIRKIESWCNKNRILGIGPGVLNGMVEKFDMVSPADLYRLEAESLAGIENGNGILGISNATKIVANIQGTRKMTLNNFLGSLGIPHLGRRMVAITREKVPGELDTLDDWRSGKIQKIDCGMPNICDPIMEAIGKLAPVIEDLLTFIEITEDASEKAAPAAIGEALKGMTFVFTGKIMTDNPETGKRYVRKELETKVLLNGGMVDDKIKKSDSSQYVLVQADPESKSSKTVDAKAKGAKIISESQFWEMIKEPAMA